MTRSQYGWLLVGLLSVAALLNYLDRQVIFSVFPLLQRDLHLNNVQLGLLGTAFLWVYGIVSPAAGFIADRFGKGRVILLSLLVWSIVTWATGHARSFEALLSARALMGISEACYLPAALAWIADYHGDRTRSLATGLLMSGNYAGIVLGGVGGGWMGEHFGWRFAFTVLGGFGVIYSFLFWLLARTRQAPMASHKASFPASLHELIQLRGFLALTAIFSAVSVANWIAYTWLPVYLYERLGLSLAEAGFSATFYVQLGSLAGILFGGWLSDRWVGQSARGRMWTQALGLGASAPFLFLAGSVSSALFLLSSLFVFGIGRGMFDCNAMPVLCQIARAPLRATGYGIYNCAGCIVGGVMTVAAGWVKTHLELSVAFQFAAVLWAGCAVVLILLRLHSYAPTTRTALATDEA